MATGQNIQNLDEGYFLEYLGGRSRFSVGCEEETAVKNSGLSNWEAASDQVFSESGWWVNLKYIEWEQLMDTYMEMTRWELNI